MTQTQEEMVLIGSFALFWMGGCFFSTTIYCLTQGGKTATMLAWRALSQGSVLGTGGEMGLSTTTQPAGSGGNSVRNANRPNYCGKDDVYCVVEEYYYF